MIKITVQELKEMNYPVEKMKKLKLIVIDGSNGDDRLLGKELKFKAWTHAGRFYAYDDETYKTRSVATYDLPYDLLEKAVKHYKTQHAITKEYLTYCKDSGLKIFNQKTYLIKKAVNAVAKGDKEKAAEILEQELNKENL